LHLSDPEYGFRTFIQNPINDIINYITEAEDVVGVRYQAITGEDRILNVYCGKIVVITRRYDL
jgi:hypothetical protein